MAAGPLGLPEHQGSRDRLRADQHAQVGRAAEKGTRVDGWCAGNHRGPALRQTYLTRLGKTQPRQPPNKGSWATKRRPKHRKNQRREETESERGARTCFAPAASVIGARSHSWAVPNPTRGSELGDDAEGHGPHANAQEHKCRRRWCCKCRSCRDHRLALRSWSGCCPTRRFRGRLY